MLLLATKLLARASCITIIACTFASAQCPVNTVMVRGRVERAPANATVRVQLLYSKKQPGEAGDATLEDSKFDIPIEFLTGRRRSKLNNFSESAIASRRAL
jgi:hypothetical protein